MIDNFEQIKTLIKFSESDKLFCHLQIIRRGKDHPNLPAANWTIKQWLVKSAEHLDKLKEDIVFLCEHYKARAYINVTPKSLAKLSTLIMRKLADNLHTGNIINPYNIFSSACGELHGVEKLWLVDIDNLSTLYIEIKDFIINLRRDSGQEYYPITEIKTKNGVHLLTRPFNLQEFQHRYEGIDVHKNNPTILYIPDSLK